MPSENRCRHRPDHPTKCALPSQMRQFLSASSGNYPLCRFLPTAQGFRRLESLYTGTRRWGWRWRPPGSPSRAADQSPSLCARRGHTLSADPCCGLGPHCGCEGMESAKTTARADSSLSMVKRQRFVSGIAQALRPDAHMVLFDNRYVAGSSTPISRRAPTGGTFQSRTLSGCSTHEVFKNFPSPEELRVALGANCGTVSIQQSQYFWLVIGVVGD